MKILTIILAFVFLSACGQGQINQSQKQTNQKIATVSPTVQTEKPQTSENECKICDFDFVSYKGDLKKEEIEGLLLALNDEYHAWATYDDVNKDFDNPRPFINIQQSEAQHIERLKQIFKTYDVPIPENKWIGNTPKFQSVGEACKAAVEAEIVNRDLYKKLFETTKREDILIVYRALQGASEENHLPAFERCGGGQRN
jgi:hypothetical protein